MWPEIEVAKTQKRREIILSGQEIAKKIKTDGLDPTIFTLTDLNLLSITSTSLKEIPDEISNLLNLQNLILHSNSLSKVNENVEKLTLLKLLDLSQNELESIPENVVNLQQIVTFNFANNFILDFPGLSTNTKLTVLDLSYNKLDSFPNICNKALVSLSEVKLKGNKIDEIPNTIHHITNLKLLDISENKVKALPGELADCSKLKDINIKSNPITDRRLLKLIDQCRTKQILDYVKQNCKKTTTDIVDTEKPSKNKKTSLSDDAEDDSDDHKYTITVRYATDECKIIAENDVKNIREHIVGCIVRDVGFTETTFKKFIQIQNKLHDNVCEKRNKATIATHDFTKLGAGNLTYTTSPPNDLLIRPLNNHTLMSGSQLFTKLQTEANNLRKEKKRSTYSGIHKYLYMIEGKPAYPCLLNAAKDVVSFPPITNSDISKIELTTTNILLEVTSSLSQFICKQVLNELLKEMVCLFDKDLVVQQVQVVDKDEKLKVVYPSKTDLVFENTVPIKVMRN